MPVILVDRGRGGKLYPMDIQVPLERMRAELAHARLIDVREPYEYEAGHIPGIEHLPLDRLGELELTGEEPIVFVCLSGARSGMAAMALRRHGVDAYSLDGGMLAWAASGSELEPADGYVSGH
jgi:hydroxyacylglutathione hydrolase/adenylyltransferase/sulfurtransferase